MAKRTHAPRDEMADAAQGGIGHRISSLLDDGIAHSGLNPLSSSIAFSFTIWASA